MRLLCPEERSGDELKVPEFCDWKIENGNFNISIPKTDVCDGEVVVFRCRVDGKTGKLSLHVGNKKVEVEEFGFSPHVILDEVWINSIIRIWGNTKCVKELKIELIWNQQQEL